MKAGKERDWKYLIGMMILTGVLILMAVFFWKTVARQAEQDRYEQQLEKENAIRAIAVYQGETLKKQVLVNMDTLEVFECELPEEGIYNRNGILIPSDVLEYGDMVRIYPSGKMERIGRADLETAQRFQDEVK